MTLTTLFQPCFKTYPYLRKWLGCRLCWKAGRRPEYPEPDTNFQDTEKQNEVQLMEIP